MVSGFSYPPVSVSYTHLLSYSNSERIARGIIPDIKGNFSPPQKIYSRSSPGSSEDYPRETPLPHPHTIRWIVPSYSLSGEKRRRISPAHSASLPQSSTDGSSCSERDTMKAVSYTHLDVYKRQSYESGRPFSGFKTDDFGNCRPGETDYGNHANALRRPSA